MRICLINKIGKLEKRDENGNVERKKIKNRLFPIEYELQLRDYVQASSLRRFRHGVILFMAKGIIVLVGMGMVGGEMFCGMTTSLLHTHVLYISNRQSSAPFYIAWKNFNLCVWDV